MQPASRYDFANLSPFLQEEIGRRWQSTAGTENKLALLAELKACGALSILAEIASRDSDVAVGDWLVRNADHLPPDCLARLLNRDATTYRRGLVIEQKRGLYSEDFEHFPDLTPIEQDAFVRNDSLPYDPGFVAKLFDFADTTLRLDDGRRESLILIYLGNPGLHRKESGVHETIPERVRGSVYVDIAMDEIHRDQSAKRSIEAAASWPGRYQVLREAVLQRMPCGDEVKKPVYERLREAGDAEGCRALVRGCDHHNVSVLTAALDDPDEETKLFAKYLLKKAGRYVDPRDEQTDKEWRDRRERASGRIWTSVPAGYFLRLATFPIVAAALYEYWNMFGPRILRVGPLSFLEACGCLLLLKVVSPGDQSWCFLSQSIDRAQRGLVMLYVTMRWLAERPMKERQELPFSRELYTRKRLPAAFKEDIESYMVEDQTELPVASSGTFGDVFLRKTLPAFGLLALGLYIDHRRN
jgi:hypothetical protein